MIDDYGVILAKKTLKGYIEEHRKIKQDEYTSFLEGKTGLVRFSIDRTKTLDGIKLFHRKRDCSDCDSGNICSDCGIKHKMKCFIYEMERACKSHLDLISRKKTYSTDFNISKRKPANERYHMLHYYEGENKPKQNNLDFESAREILLKEDYKMVVKRHFEMINNMT